MPTFITCMSHDLLIASNAIVHSTIEMTLCALVLSVDISLCETGKDSDGDGSCLQVPLAGFGTVSLALS